MGSQEGLEKQPLMNFEWQLSSALVHIFVFLPSLLIKTKI